MKKALSKPTLHFLILVIPGILWMAVMGAGFLGLLAIRDAQLLAAHDRDTLQRGIEAVNLVRSTQVHFKKQVQEWKNVLLRGHDENDFNSYLNYFNHEESTVQLGLKLLPGRLQRLGAPEEMGNRLRAMARGHAHLGERYRHALHAVNTRDDAAMRQVDRLVRGMDREITDAIDQLVIEVEAYLARVAEAARQRDENTYNDTIASVTVAMLLLAVLVLPALFFLVRRLVVRPIEAMHLAMDQVTRGDLEQEVPLTGCHEASRMAESFNHMTRELRRIYQGLQIEQDKLTTIILGAMEGIVATDRTGAVALVNPAAERLLGKSGETIREQGFLHIVDDPDYMRAYLDRNGEMIFPNTLVHRGRVLQVHASTIRATQGDVVGSMALIRDVTDEKDLEEKLRQLSITDGLTGLFNRRRFDEVLVEERSRAERYETSLAVLLLDVDHFKKFNDQYGHDQGDRVLKAVSQTLREQCRQVDTAYRFGGEEFSTILPQTNVEGAIKAGERIRKSIEEMRVDGLQVTVSIGVVVFPLTCAGEAEEMVRQADAGLYQAKREGRNRVCMIEG